MPRGQKNRSWLQSLKKRRARQNRKGLRPVLERLEDRRLLTLWTVTSLDDLVADDGQITLREAVMAAKTNLVVNEAIAGEAVELDQIRFADELFASGRQILTLTSAEPLDLGGNLSIVGPGRDADGNWLLSIDGDDLTTILKKPSGDTVDDPAGGDLVIRGIEFRRSAGPALHTFGAGIHGDDIHLEDVRFVDNHSTGFGGAIDHERGTLTIVNSVFDGNSAMVGGALHLRDPAIIRDSQFTGNTSVQNGGAINISGNSPEATIFNSLFSGNSAGSDGGAVFNSGVTGIYDSTFSRSTSDGSGGAIRNESELIVGNSVLDRNYAKINGGGISNSGLLAVRETTISSNIAVLGGGIDTTKSVLIERSTLNANVAENGGGIASRNVPDPFKTNVVNSTISGNYATNLGGGIYQAEGALLVNSSTIVLNRSDSDQDAAGDGGGLAVKETDGTISDTRLFNTILAGNLRGQTGVVASDASNVATNFDAASDTWTFSGLAAGKYRVLTTWQADAAQSSDPLFTILDQTREQGTIAVDQRVDPLPYVVDGGNDFETLGAFIITSGDLSIKAMTEDGSPVAAHSIRIERVDDSGELDDIHMTETGTTINVERSFHNLIGNPDPTSTGGLLDDPEDLGNANYVGNVGEPWDINRIIFTELADNLGGVTAVHALKPDSPAIDQGSPFLLSTEEGIPFDEDGNALVAFREETGPVVVAYALDENGDRILDANGDPVLLRRTDIVTSDQRGYPFLRSDEQMGVGIGKFPVDIGAFEVQFTPLTRPGEIVVSTLETFSDGDYSPGNLSLPEAITIANLRTDHSVIRFADSLVGAEELINSEGDIVALFLPETLEILFDTSIIGPGSNRLGIIGNSIVDESPQALFEVNPVANFVLSGLNLTARHPTDARREFDPGPAIVNYGATSLQDVEVYYRSHGTIINYGEMTIRDSNITLNSNSDGNGGGIKNYDTLAIGPNVDIHENSAVQGGGIWQSFGAKSLLIIDSKVRDNTAAMAGGGLYIDRSQAEIRRSEINNNEALNGSGGGVYINRGQVSIYDTTIDGNASSNSSLSNFTGSGGGGVFAVLSMNDTLTIDRSTISNNLAVGTTAGAVGGGIAITPGSNGFASIRSSTISSNTLRGPTVFGGGIYIGDDGRPEVSVQIESSTIAFNEALATANNAKGGGIYFDEKSILSNSIVAGNTASGIELGSDVYFDNITGRGPITDNVTDSLFGYVNVGGGVNPLHFASTNDRGNIVAPGDAGIDPELRFNGGYTKTHAIENLFGPAVDTGNRQGLLDQRGFPVTDNDFTSLRVDSSQIVNGFQLTDKIADIGAYESSEVKIVPFTSEIRDASQFSPGSALLIGVGFDDGRPNSTLTSEPGFLGLEINPDPFTFGPGVGEGLFGDKWGGVGTADIDGRAGFEYGYYINSGSVDTFYDGLFGYTVDDSSGNEIVINTSVTLQDGSLYTTSPRFGAYVDLVFEVNAKISGEACVIWCASGGFDINIDKSVPLFSINRQQEDANGNLLFLDGSGNLTTVRQQGNSPALDGGIEFASSSFEELVQGAIDDVVPPEVQAGVKSVGGVANYISDKREEQRAAEIEQEKLEKEKDRLRANGLSTNEVDAEINKQKQARSAAAQQEKAVSQKKKKSLSIDPCVGQILTVCVGEEPGDALGANFDLSIGLTAGGASIGKKLGSLSVTLPDIKLSDTELGANGRLSASTDDFIPGSPQDAKRQLAAVTADVAGIVGLYIPGLSSLGTFNVGIGPIAIEATTVSYNITPRFSITQDVAVEPFFDAQHQASFTFSGFTEPIDVIVGATEHLDLSSGQSISFMPGSKVIIKNGGQTVEITPSINVGNRFSNKIGLDLDITGALEVLKVALDAFGENIFQVGPLYKNTHTLLGPTSLFDIFDKTFDLPSVETSLAPFTIGDPSDDVGGNGETPGNAIALESGVPANNLSFVAADNLTYFAVPQIGPDGVPRTDVRFETASAFTTQFVRAPYESLTLSLINSVGTGDDRVDTVISSFPVPLAGIEIPDVPGWQGKVWQLSGFENLLGGKALFGATFSAANPQVTAEAIGGNDLAATNERIANAVDQRAFELQTNAFLIDNDFAFDIDRDGFISPTTDGELVVRYMRGLTGDDLIDGVLAEGAQRTDPNEILAYLAGLRAPFLGGQVYVVPGRSVTAAERAAFQAGVLLGRRLDVDDSATYDGEGNIIDDGVDPDIDGVLILRQMSGIGVSIASAPALTTGITFPDHARRQTPQAISDFIDGRLGPPLTAQSKDDFLRGSVRQDFLLSQEQNVSFDAVPGSSPFNPVKTSYSAGAGTYTLDTFGQTTKFEDVYFREDGQPDVLAIRRADGTPSRSLPTVTSLTKFANDPFSPEINSINFVTGDPIERSLGVDHEAPLFVELPDAAGYRLTLPEGLTVARLEFDSAAGGNAFFEREGADFELFIPGTHQWLSVAMDTPLDLPADVRVFELYPKASPNGGLLVAENKAKPTLDLVVGLVIDGASASPTLDVTILALRNPPINLAPFLAHVFQPETEYRFARNGAFLDFYIDDQPGILSSTTGLEFSFDIEYLNTIPGNGVDEFFTLDKQNAGQNFPLNNIQIDVDGFGEAIVTMHVTDADGNRLQDTFRVSSKENQTASTFSTLAPIRNQILPTGTTERGIDLSGVFWGDDLTFTASSNNPKVTTTIDGSELAIRLSEDANAVITVYAKDITNEIVGIDTFAVSIGSENGRGPILLNPIADRALSDRFQDQIFIDGLVTTKTEFTLAEISGGTIPIYGDPFVNETFIIDVTRGSLDIPLEINGFDLSGNILDTVKIEGQGVTIDLTKRDSFATTATIDIRGSGSNALILDSTSATKAASIDFLGNARLNVIMDADDTFTLTDESLWTFDADLSQYTIPIQVGFPPVTVPLKLSVTMLGAATPDPPPPAQTHPVPEFNLSGEPNVPPSQVITIDLDEGLFYAGETYSVDVAYEVSDITNVPPAILVEVHYDSSLLAFNRIENLLGASDFVPSILANNTEDLELIDDGENRTDNVVVLSWSDIRGSGEDWPKGSVTKIKLATLNFTVDSDHRDPLIRVTGDSSADFQFLEAVALNKSPTLTLAALDDPFENDGEQTFETFVTSVDPIESGQTISRYTIGKISNPTLFSSPPMVDLSGKLKFTPAPNATGSSTFEVRAFDSEGAPSDPVVAMIRVDESVIDLKLDFGDAPAIYPVTLAQNGARHTIGALRLGTSVDPETDGTPSSSADAHSDDDGLFLVSAFFSSPVATTSSFIVIASGPGKLDGWIDFNHNGDWSDAGEQIYASQDVNSGQNVLAFTIPAGASVSNTGARFRFSTAGGLAPTGAAADGEVEDYIAAIIASSPTAILDLDLPSGDSSLIVEGSNLVVRRGGVKIVELPFAGFGTLNVNGTDLDDLFQLTILEALATEVLRFDGGLGKDFLSLLEAGQTLDLTSARIGVTDIEGVDIRGTGNNTLVINIEAVKNASSTTDTLEVVADFGDQILFGDGWKAEKPQFIAGQFTHIVTETAAGGTARVEVRNDRLFQNPLNRFDVSRDGQVTAGDALRIINELARRGGSGALAAPTNDGEISDAYVDVSGDNSISALDALQIINVLARNNSVVQLDGEALAVAAQLPSIHHADDRDTERFDAAILAFDDDAMLWFDDGTEPTPPSKSSITIVELNDHTLRSVSTSPSELDDTVLSLLSESVSKWV